MELRVAGEGQLDIPEVVQRHGIDLAKASSPSNIQPSAQTATLGNIAQPDAVDARAWLLPSALDPLALQVVGDHRSLEAAGPSIGNCDGGPSITAVSGRKLRCSPRGSSAAAIDSRVHELQVSTVEGARASRVAKAPGV